jgi:hypothetical protein
VDTQNRQRDEGQTRRTVRRRTRPAAANARLHAATEGVRAADLEDAESSRGDELANAERAAKSIQDKLDRLDEAFLFERSIDIETYDRHAEKLREELTSFVSSDGNGFVRTAATAPAFSYLRGIETGNEGLVDQTGIEPVTS